MKIRWPWRGKPREQVYAFQYFMGWRPDEKADEETMARRDTRDYAVSASPPRPPLGEQ